MNTSERRAVKATSVRRACPSPKWRATRLCSTSTTLGAFFRYLSADTESVRDMPRSATFGRRYVTRVTLDLSPLRYFKEAGVSLISQPTAFQSEYRNLMTKYDYMGLFQASGGPSGNSLPPTETKSLSEAVGYLAAINN